MVNLIENARQFKQQQDDQIKVTRLILERNLTGEELSEYMSLFDDWDKLPVDEYIAELTYLKYNGALYKTLKGKGHNKEDHLNPEVSTEVFKQVSPDITAVTLPETY